MTARIALFLSLCLLSTSFAFGQGTNLPVTVTFPQVAIGGDADGQNFRTLLQIVNNNSAPTIGHLTLYSDSGAPLPGLFDGEGPESSMDIALATGESRQIQITQTGAVTAGWMKITYSPSDALTTVILQFRSGTNLLSEIGVQPAEPISTADLAVETDADLNTGLAIANPSATAGILVLVTLWDFRAGTPVAYAPVLLPPNGHAAQFLTELFPNVPEITRMQAKLSLDSCADPSCSSPGNAFVAAAIRLNGDQFTTLPVAEGTDDGVQTRILPQVAFGGPPDGLNMKTVLYFTTNVPAGISGTADIFDNEGNPLAASADGAAPSSSIEVSVAGNRVKRIVLSSDEALSGGWIRLTLSGSVHVIANAIFQTFSGSSLVSEASVLEAPLVKRGLIYVKTQSGLANVGVALANGQTASQTVKLTLFDRMGFVAATRDITLLPNGHLAQFVTELFPQLASLTEFDGALSMIGSMEFSAMALRQSSDKIATLAVAFNGMYRPAIAALRISSVQRSPAQVNFAFDVTDFDADASTDDSVQVAGEAYIDFGSAGYDLGSVSMDGTGLRNRVAGTLSGSFRPPHVTVSIPAGYPAVFYILVFDAAGNQSNVVAIPVQF